MVAAGLSTAWNGSPWTLSTTQIRQTPGLWPRLMHTATPSVTLKLPRIRLLPVLTDVGDLIRHALVVKDITSTPIHDECRPTGLDDLSEHKPALLVYYIAPYTSDVTHALSAEIAQRLLLA